MKTPKEKAKELVNKFLKCKDLSNSYYILPIIEDAKQLALIAVDEIIKSNPCYEDSDRGGNFQWNDNTYYWKEVKQEIELL